ncbi:MAG: hypothetical protein M3N43_10715 [Actinomycetota bacterium]|nr:hypothetical protein [Actinomycetota bacterium]
MRRTIRVAPAILAGALSLSCINDITLPPLGAAFTTDATVYTMELIGNARQVTINWSYQDASGSVTALQGCTGGVARWFLEKEVGNGWQEVYPVCTANDGAGIAVAGLGTASGSVIITDVQAVDGVPRISHRPVPGTYRLRFGLFENLNFETGVGSPVTDDRRYSNTFTLQEG